VCMLVFLGQQDRGDAAVPFGNHVQLGAAERAIDRQETVAVPQGILVGGGVLGIDLAPVTLLMLGEEEPRLLTRLAKRLKRAGRGRDLAQGEARLPPQFCSRLHASPYLSDCRLPITLRI